MTTTPSSPAAAYARSSRMTSGAIMGALVVLGVVFSFELGVENTPPIWVPLAQLGAGVLAHVVLETIGYRPEPLDPGMSDEEAASAGRLRSQTSTFLRMAISEFIAIASLVTAFVIRGGVWTYVGGAVVALVLLAIHMWPWSRPITKTADALESRGKTSFLRETFGLPAPGPIQQFSP